MRASGTEVIDPRKNDALGATRYSPVLLRSAVTLMKPHFCCEGENPTVVSQAVTRVAAATRATRARGTVRAGREEGISGITVGDGVSDAWVRAGMGHPSREEFPTSRGK